MSSRYNSLELYNNTFYPLILNELWAQIGQEIATYSALNFEIRENPTNCDSFALIKCEAVSQIGPNLINNMDLVLVQLDDKHGNRKKFFGVIKSQTNNKKTTLVVLIRESHAPEHSGKPFKCTLSNIIPLNPVRKQMTLVKELHSSSLCNVILDPIKHSEVFYLETVDMRGNNSGLNDLHT